MEISKKESDKKIREAEEAKMDLEIQKNILEEKKNELIK
jgi:hypothetical protein